VVEPGGEVGIGDGVGMGSGFGTGVGVGRGAGREGLVFWLLVSGLKFCVGLVRRRTVRGCLAVADGMLEITMLSAFG